jgi:hypothetical protein
MTSHDIILPPAAGATGISRSKLAAFVPITLALFGIGAILFGGISARNESTIASVSVIDPVTTGSVQSPDTRLRAMEMLDR